MLIINTSFLVGIITRDVFEILNLVIVQGTCLYYSILQSNGKKAGIRVRSGQGDHGMERMKKQEFSVKK